MATQTQTPATLQENAIAVAQAGGMAILGFVSIVATGAAATVGVLGALMGIEAGRKQFAPRKGVARLFHGK